MATILKVQIVVAIIGSVLLPNDKFATGLTTPRMLDTKPPTYPERNSPCNVVDVKPNVINESRTNSALDLSERTAELIAQIKDITKYLSEHSKLLSILCDKKTTLPSTLDTLISEMSPIGDNKANALYVKYMEQLLDFGNTMHNFNDQCTSDYDSVLSSQLQDFRQRIQSTACAMEIGLRGMGIYKGNLGASPVDNKTDSDCQSWSVRICQIYSFFGAAAVNFKTENISFQEVDHKGSVIIG